MERLTQNKDSKIIMQSLVAVPLLQGFSYVQKNSEKTKVRSNPDFGIGGSLIKFSQNDRKRNRKQRISEKVRECERK